MMDITTETRTLIESALAGDPALASLEVFGQTLKTLTATIAPGIPANTIGGATYGPQPPFARETLIELVLRMQRIRWRRFNPTTHMLAPPTHDDLLVLHARHVRATVGFECFHGWADLLDALLMRLVDLQMSFPAILVALVMLALMGRGVDKTIIALVTVQWAYYARTVRAAALVEREREYIEAVRGLRLGHVRIIAGHLLPNCIAPVFVIGTVQVAHAITLEATLSFLGIGLPETQPSLGLLISNGYQYLLGGLYWISVCPGIALLCTVLAINLVGDRLRDMLNPALTR
jgi:ABC-type methionine transport system permease subunit